MSTSTSTALAATRRDPDGSRSARRLRREGIVLGVVYGGGEDPISFQIDARELRNTLAHAGAVLDLQLDGDAGTPVVLKELVRHPVTGVTMHLDLLRVDLLKPIQAQVTLELTGADDAPGSIQGGILEHAVREVTVEALPGDIPETIEHDVSGLEIGAHTTLGEIKAPSGVTIVGEPDTVIATIHAPRLRDSGEAGEEGDIELETEVVGDTEGGQPEAAAQEQADAE
jgi:large subunit ribosomal protein L25